MTLRKEFETLFEAAKIPQRRLARLLGVSVMTVNRWFSKRDDGFEPPTYAVAFLRVYVMLPPAARDRLPLYDVAPGKPEPAKPAKATKAKGSKATKADLDDPELVKRMRNRSRKAAEANPA